MTYLIRHVEPSDAPALQRLYSDESTYPSSLQIPYPPLSRWVDRIAAEGVVMLCACAGDELVGNAGLHLNLKTPRRAHAGAIGMSVLSGWQGKGVGTALMHAIVDLADNWYGLARLELSVYPDNAAALALYKKFGFELEGTLRKHALRRGVLEDIYTMARLRARPT
jgi:putative acetyltransferase